LSAALSPEAPPGGAVIACGAGVLCREENRAALRGKAFVVWLQVEPAEAARRLAGSEPTRPLLGGGAPLARLASLLEERRELYARAADARVETGGEGAGRIAGAIEALWIQEGGRWDSSGS